MAKNEKVTRVIDGDTFKTTRRTKSIRLANVDAPEKGQPGYSKATNALRSLIKGEKVRVQTVARDKYGRAVAKVYVGNKSVNKAMNDLLKKKK